MDRQSANSLESVRRCILTRSAGIETLQIERAGWARTIHGIASTIDTNAHNRSLDPLGCRVRKMPVPVFYRHEKNDDPIGEVFFVRKSSSGVYVRAQINQDIAGDRAWDLIEDGSVRCFSVGSRAIKASIVDGVRYISEWILSEVSITSLGANRICCFEIFIERGGASAKESRGAGSAGPAHLFAEGV